MQAHGAINLLMASRLGILLEALVVRAVLDSSQSAATINVGASSISESRVVIQPYVEDDDMVR